MLKILFGMIITPVLIVLVALTVMGLVPGLSPLVGAGPKDLGIKITKDDSVKAIAKMGVELVSIKSTDSIKDYTFEGKKDVSITMDSKELTAHSNNRPWKNYPVKSLQILIHPDGTIESSGILVVSKAIPYAIALGYSESQIKDAMQKYNIPPIEVPIYVKGKGSVFNDTVSVNAQNVQIGAIPIPGDIVAQANKEAESVLNDVIQKHSSSFHAESVTFDNGKMDLKGQVPKKIYVLTE
ncbi:MAG: hypothetical protein NTV98_03380 [Candidatus Roizmanbacteria bacterium]|nr:hypothetical protein [Candidatus Roizmanbacteria bacterium]